MWLGKGAVVRWRRLGRSTYPRASLGNEESGLEHMLMFTPSIFTLPPLFSETVSGACWVVLIQCISLNSACESVALWGCVFHLEENISLGIAEPLETAFTSMGDGCCSLPLIKEIMLEMLFVHLEMYLWTQAQCYSGGLRALVLININTRLTVALATKQANIFSCVTFS